MVHQVLPQQEDLNNEQPASHLIQTQLKALMCVALEEEFPIWLSSALLGCVVQSLKLVRQAGESEVSTELQEQLQRFLRKMGKAKPGSLVYGATYDSRFREQLKGMLKELKHLGLNLELSAELRRLEGKLTSESYYTSPKDWRSLPTVRNGEDSKQIGHLIAELNYGQLSEEEKQDLFLVQLLKVVLGYHSLAHTSSKWKWAKGKPWVLQLLCVARRRGEGNSLYQEQVAGLILGLLSCLYPLEGASMTYTSSENLAEFVNKQGTDLVGIFAGLTELRYVLEQELEVETVIELLKSVEQLIERSFLLEREEPEKLRNADDLTDLVNGSSYVHKFFKARERCYKQRQDILDTQQQDSELVSNFLSQLWRWTEVLLGEPLVDTALLLLGSISRAEQGQYS